VLPTEWAGGPVAGPSGGPARLRQAIGTIAKRRAQCVSLGLSRSPFLPVRIDTGVR